MTGRRMGCAVLLGLLAASGCTDETPTSGNEGLIPDAETIEVRIPYSEFVAELQAFGGFASGEDLDGPVVAHEYRDELEAYVLARFSAFPEAIDVVPSDGESAVPDSSYHATGGRIVLVVDTVSHPEDGFVEFAASTLQSRWDPTSATWTQAVDTLGHEEAWPEAGGGPAREAGTGDWFAAEPDTVRIELDSLGAEEIVHGARDTTGVRIESRTPGTYFRVRSASFQADLRSELNPDTTVTVSRSAPATTVIFSPEPAEDTGNLLIGGTPARRAFLRLDPPRTIEAGHDLCATVPCPLDLSGENIVYAGLVLQTASTVPPALRPIEPMALDLVPALAPERIPRTPLGASVQPQPRTLVPAAFEEGGIEVEVPFTRYLRQLIGEDPEEGEGEVPNTLVLLSAIEPSGLSVAAFRGPGQEGEPVLRIILTRSEGVQVP